MTLLVPARNWKCIAHQPHFFSLKRVVLGSFQKTHRIIVENNKYFRQKMGLANRCSEITVIYTDNKFNSFANDETNKTKSSCSYVEL